MKLGKEIAQIRKQQGLTQEAFGQMFHVTRQTVSNWENEKSFPDLQTLVAISEGFGISLDSLLKEDTTMIQTIDKERRTGRRLMKGLVAIVGIVAIACASYCGYWYAQKASFERQLDSAIEAYGFSPEVITNDRGDDFFTGSYIARDGSITYSFLPPDFPALLSFKTSIDDSARVMVAECDNGEQRLILRCAPSDVMDENGEIQSDDTFTTLYLDKGFQENADGTATPILSPEYNLDENGVPYAGHLDDETRAAYDAMKGDVETAVTTMHEMLDALYP